MAAARTIRVSTAIGVAGSPRTCPRSALPQMGVANRTGCLLVDALTVLRGADNTLDPDCCHLNDLSHQLVGNAVFREIVLRA